jgi:hypothetical protein
MSAEEVLTAFWRDALYLFLGAAFAAVGMVSAAFAVLRRQRDSLLICFALFAVLYGLRLWISSPMIAMMAQGAPFYARLRGAVNHVTLIPALLFFISLGLPRRFEGIVGFVSQRSAVSPPLRLPCPLGESSSPEHTLPRQRYPCLSSTLNRETVVSQSAQTLDFFPEVTSISRFTRSTMARGTSSLRCFRQGCPPATLRGSTVSRRPTTRTPG